MQVSVSSILRYIPSWGPGSLLGVVWGRPWWINYIKIWFTGLLAEWAWRYHVIKFALYDRNTCTSTLSFLSVLWPAWDATVLFWLCFLPLGLVIIDASYLDFIVAFNFWVWLVTALDMRLTWKSFRDANDLELIICASSFLLTSFEMAIDTVLWCYWFHWRQWWGFLWVVGHIDYTAG